MHRYYPVVAAALLLLPSAGTAFSPNNDHSTLAPLDISYEALVSDVSGGAERIVVAPSRTLSARDSAEPGMTLQRLASLAVNYHPSISTAISDIYQQTEEVDAAGAGYYPSLNAGFNTGYSSVSSDQRQINYASVSASQMLYDFGKVNSAVNVASAGVLKAQASFLFTVDTVARDSVYAAIEVQRYDRLLALSQQQIEAVQRITKLAEARRQIGASSLSDAVQGRSREQSALADQLRLQAEYNRWLSKLQILVGQQVRGVQNIALSPHVEKACQSSTAMALKTPALLIAEAGRMAAKAQADQADANALPTIALEPSVRRYLDSDVRDSNEFIVAVNVSMPLYQGGRLRARKKSARHALRAADFARDQALLTAQQDLLQAKVQLQSLKGRLLALTVQERSISETRRLYEQQYLSLGTRSLLDLLNAEEELQQARSARQNSLSDIRQLAYECVYSTGKMRQVLALDNTVIQGVKVTL